MEETRQGEGKEPGVKAGCEHVKGVREGVREGEEASEV